MTVDTEVSAVIPTVGRVTLADAVRSCVDQEGPPLEVIVVADLPDDRESRARLRCVLGDLMDRVSVTFTGGNHGGAAARNVGTSLAQSEWVAYLDDDDWWHPTKTHIQLSLARRLPGEPIVSCRASAVAPRSGVLSGPIPRDLYRPGQDLPTYLFRRRRLAWDRNSLFAPTLLLRRRLALEVSWDQSLRRHQDWDFLVRAVRHRGVSLHQVKDVLVTVAVGSPGSVSRDADWESSLSWGLAHRDEWDSATLRDFIAGQPVRYALAARSVRGVWRTSRAAFDGGAPSTKAMALAAAGLVPRGALVGKVLRRGSAPR